MTTRIIAALTCAALLAACGGYTDMELAEKNADGTFKIGCGLFDPYNPNMIVRTMDGRFPGGGNESAAIRRGSEGSPTDTDCGWW